MDFPGEAAILHSHYLLKKMAPYVVKADKTVISVLTGDGLICAINAKKIQVIFIFAANNIDVVIIILLL